MTRISNDSLWVIVDRILDFLGFELGWFLGALLTVVSWIWSFSFINSLATRSL